ncbi:hypothetical protein [Pelagibacterium halotolerans]|uniref:Porin n=1 Tax=Pelagibacterium halotolerans (strain DSM 22347 / JCM 15775 / CGMCC 1.7692 / B2) TaxID=1082931 RepID=G4RF50_PELHB|nr:hypothetical protein [Pelagibacterium halotolerans]AEQ50918.1 hypothetical protein KKY_879 [Pelagibacterium halotolerans B2]QJR19181.1 hypothetical protein HKM20_12465 [Pelagibacterium halotolerans]SDZ99903.1 hypothetical protein SAMN05428936_101806 [Pelagibacterium halotolerans]
MSRVLTGLAAGLLAAAAGGQAIAADWGVQPDPVFKPAYPVDMMPYEDSLDFEAGIRYFYGMGGQRTNIVGNQYSVDDASHFIELHGRIDDHSTDTFLTANLGYAAVIDGNFETPWSGGSVSTDSGEIAYAGADFGYTPFKNEGMGLGAFVGYQYLNESPDMGRASFLTAGGGGDSTANQLEVHALRLGVAGRAEFNDAFDVTVNAAAIPYASLTGTYGAFNGLDVIDPGAPYVRGNAATISGHLYGGALDAMVGFKPTENLAIRAGARGYYLTGPTEIYYEARNSGDPSDVQGFWASGTTELFRWGPVIELTGTF